MKKLWYKILALSWIKWVAILLSVFIMVFIFIMIYRETGFFTCFILLIMFINQTASNINGTTMRKQIDGLIKYMESINSGLDNIVNKK